MSNILLNVIVQNANVHSKFWHVHVLVLVHVF